MKFKCITLLSGLFMISSTTFAQTVSTDQINAIKNDTKMLRIAIAINDQKLELAKLQNQVSEKTEDVDKATKASQSAADVNQNNATILNNDDLDKKKAHKARKSAQSAENSSSKARKAQDRLADLNKDIDQLNKDIAKNEQKLNTMGGSQYVHPSN